jgi:hypothetical protein
MRLTVAASRDGVAVENFWFSCESDPESAIEGAVLDGFADVFGGDGVGGGEVGDGAGDFQDAVVSAGAQV